MTEDRPSGDHPSRAGSPSPATAATQALSRLTDLTKVSIQALASLTRQSVDLAWATLAGSMDRASANRASVESMARESARYWRVVGELSLGCAGDLVALGKSVSETVLREVTRSGVTEPDTRPTTDVTAALTSDRRTSHVPDHDNGGRRVGGCLQGPVGGRAEGTITVANQHPRPRRIQLRAGDLVDSTGVVVAPGLDISPTTVTVPSGQERSINLGIDLDDASFAPWQLYSCMVDVSGGEEARIEVSIQVNA